MSKLRMILPPQFKHLKLYPYQPLLELRNKERQVCHLCKSSRKYYCYECNVMLGLTPDQIPNVTLPVHIDIIKHYAEKASKSTTSHARIFAPQSTSIYHYPNMPSVKNKSKAILVYPCKDSCTIEALSSKISHGQLDQVIFIDSTWNQATSIFQNEMFSDIQKVQLSTAETCYWRPQVKQPSTYLATIEAIYYFCVEYHKYILKREYHGEYDNLLYMYIFQYNLVQESTKQHYLDHEKQ
ncbi:DTW domain-containing protein 1 [Trichoplax sp. H2]|nr:DTW domain-containing protein 1 [Trichoplax sp. H2]|eukprot:RDD45361.1 DTW domain-containing protein 1 [Trichoplax sp. H2]